VENKHNSPVNIRIVAKTSEVATLFATRPSNLEVETWGWAIRIREDRILFFLLSDPIFLKKSDIRIKNDHGAEVDSGQSLHFKPEKESESMF